MGTDEDRDKVDLPKGQYDEDLEDLSHDIRRYDRDIEQLQSPSWFIDQIQKAFNRHDWPVDDKADEDLPIDYSGWTQRQVQNRNKRLRSLWENSKGLSRNSKRRVQRPILVRNVAVPPPPPGLRVDCRLFSAVFAYVLYSDLDSVDEPNSILLFRYSHSIAHMSLCQ